MASIAQSLTGIPASWIPGNDPCDDPKWDFVSCASGRVVSLNLANLSLSGELSQSINDLTALTALHLQRNNVSGPLPSLSSLSNLQQLLLDFNSFSSLPDDFFSGFTAIQMINLDHNPLAAWSISNAANSCVNLQRLSAMRANVIGSIPSFLASFSSLQYLRLPHNDLTGVIPMGLAGLKQLSYVDLSSNNLTGKVPNFSPNVTLLLAGNPFLEKHVGRSGSGRGRGGSPPSSFLVSPPPPFNPIVYNPPAPHRSLPSDLVHRLHSLPAGVIAGIVFGFLFVLLVSVLFCWLYRRWRMGRRKFDRINPDSHNDDERGIQHGLVTGKNAEKECEDTALMKAHRGQPMRFENLRKATNDFCQTNFLGSGGFGVVYRGELDGTIVAVKRSNNICGEADEKSFNAEIDVLKSVRHQNLVALLGYCTEYGEKLLVYEFMSNGSLADHLFDLYKTSYPLNWKQRVTIALDVARGVEYLHSQAHKSFIHRDLKPSNILLDYDLRAKVSDFGLVKLAHTMRPITTKLAGTFGYLAPEYALNGKVTRKVDVYAFGVVLMEIITSKKALDPSFPEDEHHIAIIFNESFKTENHFKEFMDPTFRNDDDAYACAYKVAELAIHCTLPDPQCRPEMSHAVKLLGQWLRSN